MGYWKVQEQCLVWDWQTAIRVQFWRRVSLTSEMYASDRTKTCESTGYGQHGDYLFGWKDDSLQKAMDALPGGKCANANCSVLKIQSAKDSMACKKAQQAKENVGQNGDWLKELPGGNMVTYAN